MPDFVPLGICKAQLDPVCANGEPDPTRVPMVLCNLLNIDQNNRTTDGFTIEDPSGIPGQNCIELELPGSKKPPEIVIDTCNVFSPEFDAIASACNNVYYDERGEFIGMAAAPKEGDDCLCACEENEEACNRWDLIVWQMAFCPGASGSRHPDGKFVMTRYPNIEFQPQDGTISTTNELSGARRYLAIAYEPTGPGYAGPADITPVGLPFNSCVIGPWLADDCPPGECGCGGCEAEAPTPLAAAARRRSAAPSTNTSTSSTPSADSLTAA